MIHYITTNGIGNPWVAAELRGIQDEGIPVKLHTMRSPGSHFFRSEWARRMNDESIVIYPMPKAGMLLAALAAPFRFGRRFWSCLLNALFGSRESLRARIASIAHVFVATYWANLLRRSDVTAIHAQWIHSCGTIGMYGAWLLDVPFSFTGHAVDLFRDRCALRDKIRRARFIVCISDFHGTIYLENGAKKDQLITVHCGIEIEDFEFRQRDRLNEPAHIISLGRLVEKKGFEYLIDACEILRARGVAVRCTIGGDGPLTEPLQQRVREKNLGDTVNVTGARVLQEELTDFMNSGDIFAQPCVWSSDQDVDGTPRTLMEAMACGLPSVGTRLAGLPDIIEDGESGLLVEPNDANSLADAIERIIREPELAVRLSAGGRRKIERDFKLPDCLDPLVREYRRLIQERTGAAPIRPERDAPPVTAVRSEDALAGRS